MVPGFGQVYWIDETKLERLGKKHKAFYGNKKRKGSFPKRN
jgi:hypothetical protein